MRFCKDVGCLNQTSDLYCDLHIPQLPMTYEYADDIPVATPGASKHDSAKVRMELLSPVALEELSKVLTFGAKKYASHNWRKGLVWSRLLGAALRHLLAFMGGQDKDPETGISHINHAMCNLMFLSEFEHTHPELDDRYKKENK